MPRRVLSALLLLCSPSAATEPNQDTARWWRHTAALASDANEGRDTGSAGYRRAEDYVIREMTRIGLKPAGTDGFRQPVPIRATKLDTAASRVWVRIAESEHPLAWLREVTVAVRPVPAPQIDGPIYFAGDPATVDPAAVRGKVVLTASKPRLVRQPAPAIPEGALAILTIDRLGGPEPPRWPAAYAVSYALQGAPAPENASSVPTFRVNPAAAAVFFTQSGHTPEEQNNFALPGEFHARLVVHESEVISDNIIAVRPGADPTLRDQYVVLSAHLDGYGIGEPWHGDRIYNGALDDAAYVATLLDLAEHLQESHTHLKRSLLFCIVTGEEKGLLGSKFFAAHPTIPKQQLVADLNLDQLRPIFPLNKLTVLALKDSTLGDEAQQVAARFDVRVQPDPEPERRLLMRSDHWSFMQIGVPALNFVFGYDKGSEDEATYRAWYAQRYHSPADDLQQPWVPEAAARFNHLYGALVEAVANASTKPEWKPDSPYRPH